MPIVVFSQFWLLLNSRFALCSVLCCQQDLVWCQTASRNLFLLGLTMGRMLEHLKAKHFRLHLYLSLLYCVCVLSVTCSIHSNTSISWNWPKSCIEAICCSSSIAISIQGGPSTILIRRIAGIISRGIVTRRNSAVTRRIVTRGIVTWRNSVSTRRSAVIRIVLVLARTHWCAEEWRNRIGASWSIIWTWILVVVVIVSPGSSVCYRCYWGRCTQTIGGWCYLIVWRWRIIRWRNSIRRCWGKSIIRTWRPVRRRWTIA